MSLSIRFCNQCNVSKYKQSVGMRTAGIQAPINLVLKVKRTVLRNSTQQAHRATIVGIEKEPIKQTCILQDNYNVYTLLL